MDSTTQEPRHGHGYRYRYREYVRSVVRTAPPLTDEQRDRLAALIAVGT